MARVRKDNDQRYLLREEASSLNVNDSRISNTQITNWDTAYGWGDHAAAGYLTSYTETDTLDSVTGRGATTSNNITVGNVTCGAISAVSASNKFAFTGDLSHTWLPYTDQRNYISSDVGTRIRKGTSGGYATIADFTSTGMDLTGAIVASGNITAYSDERLKSDVQTLDGTKVFDMRGTSYVKDGELSSGVIAQELQKVAPELVHEGEEYLSVAYGNLVGYLIEAVKHLNERVKELEDGVTDKRADKS